MRKRGMLLFLVLAVLAAPGRVQALECPDPVLIKVAKQTSPKGKLALKTVESLATSSLTPEQMCRFLKDGFFPKTKDAAFSPEDAALFYHSLALTYIAAKDLPRAVIALKLGISDRPTDRSYQLLIRTYDALGEKDLEARAICDYARFLAGRKKTVQALLLLKSARKRFACPTIDLLIGKILAQAGDRKAETIFEQEAVEKAKGGER